MDEDIRKHVRHGTTTVGIVCKDGIILAADKRATLGGMLVANKKETKIVKITDNIAVTTAGVVSDIQLILKLIKAEINLKKIRTGREQTVKEVSNLFATMIYQNIRKFSPIPGITGFLLGGKDETGTYLYELAADGVVGLRDDFATDGSGMVMAWGVLDTLYKKDMSIEEGIQLAMKVVNASMQRDTASGEGIDIYTITKKGAKHVLEKMLDTRLRL